MDMLKKDLFSGRKISSSWTKNSFEKINIGQGHPKLFYLIQTPHFFRV